MHTRAHGWIRLRHRKRNMSQSRESVRMLDKYGGPECYIIDFWDYESRNAVTYDTCRKPWTMMIYKRWVKILRMDRDMKLCTHFQDASTTCRTVMSSLRLGRLRIS